MTSCTPSYSQRFSCDSNYHGASNSYASHGKCETSSHTATANDDAVLPYQSHATCLSVSYTHTHHSNGGSIVTHEDSLALALQDATQMGAGAQGQIGCMSGSCDNDNSSGLNSLPPADNADGDTLAPGDVSNLSLVLGNGASDLIIVGVGDNNSLVLGNGPSNMITLNTGDNNDIHTGNGDGDAVLVGTGDNNCVTVGNGNSDCIIVGTGSSNSLHAGDGASDVFSIDSGDNNLLSAGNGAGDFLLIGTGDHNTLCVGDGAGDVCLVNTGYFNVLHAGNGAGDTLFVATGDYNALIAGNGTGDVVVAQDGNSNILAVGGGNSDMISLGAGDNNIIVDGNGANDTILVGGSVGATGLGVNSGNTIVIGDGDGDQAWGSLGDGNSYLSGAGNDIIHTGGGADFVYVDNHTEQSAAAMADPFHLTTQDSLAQNLFADGGNDTFAIQGTCLNTCQSYNSACGNSYSTSVTWQNALHQMGGDAPGLGTTVMTGGGGVEQYWFSDLWGNAVITDFNSAHGDRVMIGGVSDPNISALGPVHMQYIHSAYDAANTGNVDLLITFGSSANLSQSITLIDYKPQDTGGTGGSMQFNNMTFNNPQNAETALSHIFDFSLADNEAVTNQIAALAAQHLILH